MNHVSADHITATANQNNANWPPKSPLEALLSSPNGKRRWQQHQDRISQDRDRDVSPSPRKQPPSSNKALQDMMAMSDGDEDDEEILQLQLQAIQAKLRLKKLQKQKSSQSAHDDDSRPSSENSNSPRKRQKTHASTFDTAVQVTVSPIKSHMPPPPLPGPTSPARVLLGIDKGLRAKDVSLKRARNGTTVPSKTTTRTTLPTEPERPKQSFSDRIAASRLSAEQQQAKHERIEKSRSQGFGLAAQAERQHNPDRNCHVHKAIDQPDNYLRRAVSVASVVQYLHRQLHKVHPYPSVLLSPLRQHLKSEVDRPARPRASLTMRRTHLPNLRPMDPASKASHHYIYPSEKSPTQH